MALEVMIDACPLCHVQAADSNKANKRNKSLPRPQTISTHIAGSFVVVASRMVVAAVPHRQFYAPTTGRHDTRRRSSNGQASAQG